MKKTTIISFLVLLTIGVSSDGGRKFYRIYHETYLAEINFDKVNKGSIALSPDKRHIAFVQKNNGGYSVVLDSKVFPSYPAIENNFIYFSPDSRHIAYITRKKNGSFSVIYDEKEIDSYDNISKYGLVFSPDSQSLAYAALKGKSWLVIKNGEVMASLENVGGLSPFFSPDSQKLAFVGLNGGKWFVSVDGVKYEHENIMGIDSGAFYFTKDSRNFFYLIQREGKWLSVYNGKEGEGKDDIDPRTIAFGENDKVAYLALNGRDKETAVWYLILEKSGKSLPLSLSFMDKEKVEIGQNKYDILGRPVFSADGKILSYAVREEGQWKMVVGGEKSSGYLLLTNPVFHDKTNACAYGAVVGEKKYFVVLNGKEGKNYESISFPEFVFSRDGSRYAYPAMEDGKWIIASDQGEYGKKYDGIVAGAMSFIFNNKIVFVAEIQKKQSVVIETTEGPFYDYIFLGGNFKTVEDSTHQFHYLGAKGKNIYLVEEEIRYR